MLWLVSEQPAIEMLVHHRGCDFEMQRWRAALAYRLRIEFPLNCRRVIDNLQMCSAGQRSEVPWTLRRRRMMQELRRVAFHDSINIVNAKLALVNKEPTCRRLTFEQRDRSFDSTNPAVKRPDYLRDVTA